MLNQVSFQERIDDPEIIKALEDAEKAETAFEKAKAKRDHAADIRDGLLNQRDLEPGVEYRAGRFLIDPTEVARHMKFKVSVAAPDDAPGAEEPD